MSWVSLVTGQCTETTALSLTSHISPQKTWLITCPPACKLRQKVGKYKNLQFSHTFSCFPEYKYCFMKRKKLSLLKRTKCLYFMVHNTMTVLKSNHLKAALIKMFYINNGSNTLCIVKGVACSDEPTKNYHPALHCLSALRSLLVYFPSLFWISIQGKSDIFISSWWRPKWRSQKVHYKLLHVVKFESDLLYQDKRRNLHHQGGPKTITHKSKQKTKQ